jgi:hypothetical protein
MQISQIIYNMKRCRFIFLLAFLIIPNYSFSQQNWFFSKVGNAFDGYGFVAIQNSIYDNDCSIAVINRSIYKNLENKESTDEEYKKGINNLEINIMTSKKSDTSPDKILISFDESNQYFILNYSDDFDDVEFGKSYHIYIKGALSSDFNVFYGKLDIISMFKLSKVVHIRIITGEENKDYDFSLNGSTEAINKVFTCPYKFVRTGSIASPFFDGFFHLLFIEHYRKTNNLDDLNYDIVENCRVFLDKKYGEYYWTYTSEIKYNGRIEDSTTKIYFYNRQENIVAEIGYKIYSRNARYFSGSFKNYIAGKLQNDIPSLQYYYEAFVENNIIDSNIISKEKFDNFNKKEIEFYYKKMILNEKLLNYLRIDNNINYRYSKSAYTLKVFSEPWGEAIL